MAEFERVPLRPPPKRDWLPTAVTVVVLGIGLAIVKPWDLGRATTGAEGATPQPTFFVRPTERTGPRPYDPILFGNREPDPAWELWPAGYVVEFGMSGPVRVHEGASPAPIESGTAVESAVPIESVGPSPRASMPPDPSGSLVPSAPPATPPLQDNVVDLGTTDHLVALGINTPADVRIETITLSRLTDEAITPVPVVRLPTYWESSHFIAIAPEDQAAPGQAAPWEPALYRLQLTTAFGEVRVIDLRVRPPLAPKPTQGPEVRPPLR
jgi:hypothetical protein